MSDGSLIFDTRIDSSGFKSGINGLKSIASTGVNALKTMATAATATTVALGGIGAKCVSIASDLSEVQNVVDVTFGDGASKIEEWSKKMSNSFGIGELQAKQFAGTLGAMTKSMGLTDEAVYDMSTNLTQLAGDMASFYNLDTEEAFEKIRSGISGETEPLKQLGINMSVANLEAYALSQGINKAYNEMTQAEQATLRYNYLMSTTADAQGDFARTSDSLANQLRILKLNITDLGASIGKSLLPMAQQALGYINNLVNRLKEAFDTGGITGLATELGNVLADITNKIAEYMPKFIDIGTEILLSLANGILANTDNLINSMLKIGESIVACLYKLVPKMVEIGENLLSRLAQGAESGIYHITTKAFEIVTGIVKTINRNLPLIFNAGVGMLKGLASGIKDNLPMLLDQAVDLLINFVIEIGENLDIVVKCALDIILALAKGLIKNIPKLVEKAPEMLKALGQGIIDSLWVLAEAIASIVTYIGDGLANADWSAIANNVLNGLAKYLIPGGAQLGEMLGEALSGKTVSVEEPRNKRTMSKSFGGKNSTLDASKEGILKGVTSKLANKATDALKELEDTTQKSTGAVIGLANTLSYSKANLDIFSDSTTKTEKKVADLKNQLLYTKSNDLMQAEKKLQEQQNEEYSKLLAEKAKIGLKAIQESYKKQYDAESKLISEKEDKINKLELKQQAKNTLLQNAQAMSEVDDSYKTLTEAELKAIAEKSENTKNMNVAEMLDGEKEITIEQLKAITDRYSQIAEIEKENLNAEKDIQQQMLNSYTSVYNGLVDGYEKVYDEITNKQNSLADKLKSFGTLFDKVEKTINEQGDTKEFMQLGDLGEDVKQLQLLSQGIEELRKRGVNQDFLDNYLSSQSVEDSLDFTELLLAQNKETLQSYVKTWEEKNRLAEELSANFYQTEYDTLKEQFTDKVKDELNIMPEEAEQVGQDTAQKLADGLKSGYESVKNAVGDLVGLMKSTVESELFNTGVDLGVTSTINQNVQTKDSGIINALGAILGAITADTNTPIIIEMDGNKVGESTVDGTLRELKRRGVSIDGIN